LVIYTGVIAMVRKAIICRTGEYADEAAALMAAGSYTHIVRAVMTDLWRATL